MLYLRYLYILGLILILNGCGSTGLKSRAVREAKLSVKVEDPINPITRDSAQWVIEGKIKVSVTSMDIALNKLRVELKDKGDVTRQDIRGQQSFPRASLTLRVKPQELPKLLAWLREAGQVEYEEVAREEVSRRLLAQNVAIKNAQATLARLKVFIDKDNLRVDEVLKVETEMKRLREIIDKNEGDK